MNNVLIFSDLHIHSHKNSSNRLEDCIQVLEWVFDSALKNHVENIFFLGDLFHDRRKIEVLTLFKVFEVFEKYFGSAPPFQLHLLLGNHDLWHRDKWDIHSPVILRAFKGVNIIDKPCTLNIQGHWVDFLPFTENPVSDLNQLKSLVSRKPGEHRMLCSHLAIDGAKLNAFTESDVVVEHDGEMVRVDQTLLNSWTKVYLGHYHGQQRLGSNSQIEYVGSPLELTRAETGQQKHIILHDLDTFKSKYIINDFSPKHLIIDRNKIGEEDLSGHFVTVLADTTSSAEIADLKKEISSSYQVGSLEIRPNRTKKSYKEDHDAIISAKAILETHEEMLKRYIAEVQPPETNFDQDLLLSIGLKLIESLDEEVLESDEKSNSFIGQLLEIGQ